MALRALELDYARRTRRTPWLGIVILLAGAAVAAAAAAEYSRLTSDLRSAERRSADLERRLERKPERARTNAKDAQVVATQVAYANDVLRQLATPWDSMFHEVEAAHDERVALLSIEPDPQKSVVRISGEARSLDDVLEYVKRLSQSPFLTDVYLQNHQVQTLAPDQPTRFALMAGWRPGK